MRRRLFAVPVLAALLLGASHGAFATPLVNGDFSAGFTGWSGAITDSGTSAISGVDPSADSHFAIVGGLAELSNDFDFFEVALFQEIMLPAGASTLSFEYDWSITCGDPNDTCADSTGSGDFLQAAFLVGGSVVHDLFPLSVDLMQLSASGVATTDISAFAGQTVTIEFLLQDGDFDEADRLAVGAVTITVAVPEPASLVLFALGLVGLAARRSSTA